MTTPVFEKDHNIRLETDLTFTKESKCDNFVAHKIILHFPFYPKFTPSFTLTKIIFTQILPNFGVKFNLNHLVIFRMFTWDFQNYLEFGPSFLPLPKLFFTQILPIFDLPYLIRIVILLS